MSESVAHSPVARSGLRTYGRLLGYLRPLWLAFAVSLLGFALYALTQSAFAGLMQYLPTAFSEGGASVLELSGDSSLSGWESRWGLDDPERVRTFLPVALMVIVALRGLGSYLGGYYITYVARHVVNRLRIDVFAHINQLPAAYLAKRNSR